MSEIKRDIPKFGTVFTQTRETYGEIGKQNSNFHKLELWAKSINDFGNFERHFPCATSAKILAAKYARVPQAMAPTPDSNRFQLSSRSIMFVLSRTVWVRNSLFITVEGEMFSLVKISGKLYKSCMCLIITIVQMFIYYMDRSVLLGTKPLVDSIRHFIRDLSGVFSVCHLCECRIVQ